jgi:hypothetical protein
MTRKWATLEIKLWPRVGVHHDKKMGDATAETVALGGCASQQQ